MSLIVTAGYVTVETAVPGGRAAVDIPRGAALPDDVPDEQRDTLLRLGHVAQVTTVDVPEPAGDPAPGVPEGTVAAVLEWVAGDPGRAQAAADAERAGRARTTLLAALAELVGA